MSSPISPPASRRKRVTEKGHDFALFVTARIAAVNSLTLNARFPCRARVLQLRDRPAVAGHGLELPAPKRPFVLRT